MNQICPSCKAENQSESRFCQLCGATLSATMVQGRTVIAAVLPAQSHREFIPQDQVQTIVAKAEKAFGAGVMTVATNPVSQDRAHQREHTVMVNDISGSMSAKYAGGMSKLEASKRASVTMVLEKAQLDPNDEIGLVSFDHKARRLIDLCPLHSHKPQIIKTIQSLQIEGGTDINAGLRTARDMFNWSRKGIVRRIVLLTDGHGGHPLRTVDNLKGRGVVIDVIGVGKNSHSVDEKLLKQVASTIDGENHYWFIKDQQTLVKHYTQLANKTATGA